MTDMEHVEEAQKRSSSEIPDFASGDTVRVRVRVTDGRHSSQPAEEGVRVRLQAFEGVVIAIRNRGLSSSFTLRRIAHGVGVERVFHVHSPLLAEIAVVRHGRVRRSKLYYQRQRSGRAARIREKLEHS